MNNKGQALVEFVLILPILILILFVIIDFGMIINKKNSLENISVDVISFIKNDKPMEEIREMYSDISIDVTSENDYLKVSVFDSVDIITPGLNRVLDDPYVIIVERFVYND